jgi:probable rRNA maturation factor
MNGLPASRPAEPSISVQCATRGERIDVTWLADALRRVVLRATPVGADRWGEIVVRVVDDPEMTRLHARHRGDATTTDVLTFPDASDGRMSVDLAVCRDEAARQAATRGHRIEEELLLYAVHGLLHCAGYDDHDPDAAAAMHAQEDRLLGEIGVGPVYGRRGDS